MIFGYDPGISVYFFFLLPDGTQECSGYTNLTQRSVQEG